jgi:hypothetical protein
LALYFSPMDMNLMVGDERVVDDVMLVVTVKLVASGTYNATVYTQPGTPVSHHLAAMFVAQKQILDGIGLKEN